jgi:hypothetical protein
MKILPRSLRTPSRGIALVAALTVASMVLPAMPAVHAESIGGNGETATCYWDGKAYSPGGVVTESDGTKHTCKTDGTWNFALTVSVGATRFHGPLPTFIAPLPVQPAQE